MPLVGIIYFPPSSQSNAIFKSSAQRWPSQGIEQQGPPSSSPCSSSSLSISSRVSPAHPLRWTHRYSSSSIGSSSFPVRASTSALRTSPGMSQSTSNPEGPCSTGSRKPKKTLSLSRLFFGLMEVRRPNMKKIENLNLLFGCKVNCLICADCPFLLVYWLFLFMFTCDGSWFWLWLSLSGCWCFYDIFDWLIDDSAFPCLFVLLISWFTSATLSPV